MFYPGRDPQPGHREPTGVKPVLAEAPPDFAELPEEQQDRFVADLAAQLLGEWSEGRLPYRPEGDREEHS